MRKFKVVLDVVMVCAALFVFGCGQANGKGLKLKMTSPVDASYEQAQELVSSGKLLEARSAFQQIVTEHPDYKEIEKVQNDLYSLNMRILFSNIQSPEAIVHEVKVGDTLGKISKQYNVTMDLIKTCNSLKGETVRVGQKLRIWTGKFSILVNKSQNTLMLKSGEEVLKVYSVSTGANNSTPVGSFKIVTKLENPVWFKAGAVIPPESPDNVLGTRWLGFNLEGYGIHGTVEPDKIGQQVTAGCVRMRNDDVEELYKVVPRGTEVTVVD